MFFILLDLYPDPLFIMLFCQCYSYFTEGLRGLFLRKAVISMPITKVNEIQIQKRGCIVPSCMLNVGINGMKALASPWAYSPENDLLPEIFRIHENMKEYPVIRSINPPKFIWL